MLGGTAALGATAYLAACGLFGDDYDTIAYGEAETQKGELFLPSGDGPHPTVVVLHGGAWQDQVDRSVMRDLSRWLRDHGWAAWNVDYRRVGDEGGGWPGTLDDAAAAVDHVAVLADEGEPLDPARTLALGHSAGGQLALWAAARAGLPADAPGSGPVVQPVAAISMAGVTDLVAAAGSDSLGEQTRSFLGGAPDEQPLRYEVASPAARIPLGVPQVVAAGQQDDPVILAMARTYAVGARQAGDQVDELEPADTNHFSFLDPESRAWQEISQRLGGLLP